MDVFSIFIYFLMFFICCVFAYRYYYVSCPENKSNFERYKYILIIGLILIPSIFAGIRYNVGTDYQSYVNMYNELKTINLKYFFTEYIDISGIEPLFYLLCKFVYWIYDDSHVMFFVSELTIFIFIILGLKNFKIKKYLYVSIAIFLFYFYPISLNAMRHAIAVSIVFYAFSNLWNYKYFKAFIYILIAGCMHKTAIVFLICFLLARYNYALKYYIRDRIYYILILFTPGLIYLFMMILQFVPVLSDYLVKYNVEYDKGGFGFLIPILPTLIPIVWGLYKKRYQKNDLVLINLLLLQIPLTYLGYFVGWAVRMGDYARIMEMILVPKLISSYEDERIRKKITFYYLVFYIIYFIYYYFYLGINQIFPFNL